MADIDVFVAQARDFDRGRLLGGVTALDNYLRLRVARLLAATVAGPIRSLSPRL